MNQESRKQDYVILSNKFKIEILPKIGLYVSGLQGSPWGSGAYNIG